MDEISTKVGTKIFLRKPPNGQKTCPATKSNKRIEQMDSLFVKFFIHTHAYLLYIIMYTLICVRIDHT